jgi:hypothetical protein
VTPLEQLLAQIEERDPFLASLDDVLPVQLAALRERVDRGRANIPVLDRRARDVGIQSVDTLAHVVPLLFSDRIYKSYPETFIRGNRWDRMTAWYATLTPAPVADIDLTDVHNIDSWLESLWSAGHYAKASSGTSGKCSFLPAIKSDVDFYKRVHGQQLEWSGAGRPNQDRRWYQLLPRHGHQAMIEGARMRRELYARPDAIKCLTETPMLVSDVNKGADLRKAIADGTASPADIAQFECEVAVRAEEMRRALDEMTADILDHRDEPLMISGIWAQHWAIMERARAAGVPDGTFNSDSVIIGLGGTKGARLPSDYQDRVYRFYGETIRPQCYAMTELGCNLPACHSGRYHVPPWVLLLILDETGEKLLPTPLKSKVTGRAAFFNLALEGRWGGVISGDQITVDYGMCLCGRPGPAIAHDVSRYAELGGDDKLTCAGTMDAYVRGVIEA